MKTRELLILTALAASSAAVAQGRPYVFTTSQTEQTVSGSGGTVLQALRPNEISMVEFAPCPVVSAEKWVPRTALHTMAGDENSDAMYWNPGMFGAIDALLEVPNPVALTTPRDIFWSPSQAMGNGVSANPFRPGDVGRLRRIGAAEGQVEYFITAENIQLAMGLPITPIVVDVDAMASDPGLGIFFSLDGDHIVTTPCGILPARDGAILHIPASAIAWTPDLRVSAVLPASAHVVYSEVQVDAMVAAAQVTDRNGVCLNAVVDLECLDIDYTGPFNSIVPCPGVFLRVPTLVFSAEPGTGASLLSTAFGGQIHNHGCGPIGQSCGFGPTFGFQMGLQPPSALQGVASHINALSSSFPQRFTIEPQAHVIPVFNPVVLDIYSPGAPTFVFTRVAPSGINAIAPSVPFPNFYFPDLYILPPDWSTVTGPGYSTIASPPVPWPTKLVWQAATVIGSQFVLSTPAMVDVL